MFVYTRSITGSRSEWKRERDGKNIFGSFFCSCCPMKIKPNQTDKLFIREEQEYSNIILYHCQDFLNHFLRSYQSILKKLYHSISFENLNHLTFMVSIRMLFFQVKGVWGICEGLEVWKLQSHMSSSLRSPQMYMSASAHFWQNLDFDSFWPNVDKWFES